MRTSVLVFALLILGCSGREPPGVGRFDAAGLLPDTGLVADVVLADIPTDAPGDVAMIPQGGVVPEFSLPDLNPSSRTHNMTLTPLGLRPRLVAYYFSNAI
ncbi:MAG: hypothetical protein U0325_03295 [Polyangiales bacterium]